MSLVRDISTEPVNMTTISTEYINIVDIIINNIVDKLEVLIPMLANQNSFCILQINSV